MRYAVIIEKGDQNYSAYVPDLPGCAAAAETNLFVTNDARLSRKTVAGVDFIVPLNHVFL